MNSYTDVPYLWRETLRLIFKYLCDKVVQQEGKFYFFPRIYQNEQFQTFFFGVKAHFFNDLKREKMEIIYTYYATLL